MAKKHYGKLIAFAAVAGAVTAGISYFIRYKSFHEELDEDFHDFEDDFDKAEEAKEKVTPPTRSYVSLTPDRQPEKREEATVTEPADKADTETSAVTKDCSPEPETAKTVSAEVPASTTTIVEDTAE